jgi:hypothetical protein
MATNDGRDDIGISSDDEQTHDDMQECIEECLNCHAVCTMTLQHCIASGGDRTEVNLIGILLDCAELAQVSANFMLRGSPITSSRAARAPNSAGRARKRVATSRATNSSRIARMCALHARRRAIAWRKWGAK